MRGGLFAENHQYPFTTGPGSMPLFLNPDRYVNVPLEATYLAAYRGMPAFWREVLEGRQPQPL